TLQLLDGNRHHTGGRSNVLRLAIGRNLHADASGVIARGVSVCGVGRSVSGGYRLSGFVAKGEGVALDSSVFHGGLGGKRVAHVTLLVGLARRGGQERTSHLGLGLFNSNNCLTVCALHNNGLVAGQARVHLNSYRRGLSEGVLYSVGWAGFGN